MTVVIVKLWQKRVVEIVRVVRAECHVTVNLTVVYFCYRNFPELLLFMYYSKV